MLTRIDIDGERYRLNAGLTRQDVATFKAYARTVPLTGDPVRDAKALRPLMRLLIDRRDWRQYQVSSIAHRRGYAQHKEIAQRIIEGCGLGDLLDWVG